ncbi:MAG TPA: tripartite tricarboxylate transporter substrate-binding protein, partial [Reyranella sp.]
RRADCALQGGAGQVCLRVVGARLVAASQRRAVQGHGRRRYRARALQGRRRRLRRPDRGRGADDVRQHILDVAAGARRQGEGLGRHLGRALEGADLPAIAETLPGYVATSWYGAGAPAGTPEPILVKLEAAITAALATPEIQKRWTDDLGLDVPPPGRKGFDQFLAEDRKLWAPAVKASGVKLD